MNPSKTQRVRKDEQKTDNYRPCVAGFGGRMPFFVF